MVCWNARSLLRKSHDFKVFLDGLRPVVVGVCESWFSPDTRFRLRGYSLLRVDRPRRADRRPAGGGLAVMVREDVPCQPLPLRPFRGGVLEVLALRVELERGWSSVLLVYNPCRHVTLGELDHYFDQLPSPALVMGDFNARHRCWEPVLPLRSRNASGSSLFNSLLGSDRFSLLSPPGLHTRFDPHTGLGSVLDLCLGDATFRGADYSLGPYLGSDHLPLIASFPVLSLNLPCPTRPRWRFSEGGWSVFTDALALPCPAAGLPLEVAAGSFSSWLVSAGRRAFSLSDRRRVPGCGVPWWTDACRGAVQARRQAWSAWRRCLSGANKLRYRRLDAECTRVLVAARRLAWSSFVSSLSFSSSASRTWRFLSAMKGRASSFSFPLRRDGVALLSDLSKADFLASFFSSLLSTPVPLPDSARLADAICVAEAAPSPPGLSLPFTPQELSSALSALSPRKAAGPDLVPYEFLLSMPSSSSVVLLDLYNRSWAEGVFPGAWKESVLLPFPKPGKDLSSPSGYRPIVLLQCVGKLMERLVCARLQWWAESRGALLEEQCGFRPGRGST